MTNNGLCSCSGEELTKPEIYINGGRDYDYFRFSGGEEHVRLNGSYRYEKYNIQAKIKNSRDLMVLLLLNDSLKRRGDEDITLSLHYVPYARQDRVCNVGESFSLKVFCDLINACGFDKVYITDPHSDVAPALLNNVVIQEQHSLTQCIREKYDSIISPDGGALKKAFKTAQYMKAEVIVASKVRDVSTGDIVKTEVHADIVPDKVLIVDDICDGGRTFIELAKVLRAKGAETVDLYVTHGIFSKGFEVFEGLINTIYTTDSFYNGDNPKVKVIA
ncbi:MAG: ribose-phosphate pyrophosphokinase [Planctomycetes bacterium]|nr:ribose-phosphate pyrophosphokinase [Planctomycetota bacterium]